MKKEDIEEKIEKHQLWLENEPGGIRADFSEADLSGIDLSQINLSFVRFFYTNLANADLTGSKLNSADLTSAQLSFANISHAELINANLKYTVFNYTNLSDTNLSGADLTGADLFCANLVGAVLSVIKTNFLTRGIHPAPEGSLIGWGKKNGKLVKLLIPADAKRSCATSRKHRAEYAQVVWIEGGLNQVVVENSFGITVYEIGQIVRCHEWEEDRWKECAGGIHFFLTQEEAKAWD